MQTATLVVRILSDVAGATTGLDATAERAFLATLATACEGRSLLLITHRLTGGEPLDRALRLVGGRLLPATA